MKSILIVATIPDTLTAFLLPFVKHFRSAGWRVDGMANNISDCPQCQQEFDQIWDVEWSRNPLDPKNFFVSVPKVQEIVAQGDYDIVHVHTPVAAFVTRYALKSSQAKGLLQVFYTAHGFHFHPQGNPLKNLVFIALEKLAGKWTDCLITINKEDTIAAKKHRLLPSESIQFTPGIGLDISHYSRATDEEVTVIKNELQLASTDTLLLCVAEFIPRKRHSDILNALKNLNRPDIHLALAGRGDIFEEIQDLVKQLNLQNQVHFLGFRSDIPQLISASDGVMLNSAQEGLPRSIMEALAIGTPVIGSDIRGIQDLLEDECGLLVELGDIEGLAKAIAWVADNPDLAKNIAENGQRKIAEYDVQSVIQIYSDLYEQALIPSVTYSY